MAKIERRISMKEYRMEHPNPQFQRENWMNLNGLWSFTFDFGKSGMERKLYLGDEDTLQNYDCKIRVPFCPESSLSGIGYKDFIAAVWYRKEVDLSEKQLEGRTILHFGAVDYECRVFINGEEAGKHIGGYSSFEFDITDYVHTGKNIIVVYAEDDVRSGLQARGKQSGSYYSQGCDYTRTTGIWQTVWLEFVPKSYVKSVKYYPDIAEQCFYADAKIYGKGKLTMTAYYNEKECGTVTKMVTGDNNKLRIPLNEMQLWECGNGRLYDIKIKLESEENGKHMVDGISSYAGMRQIQIDGYRFILNGVAVFQRTVLDQGFYREGIYTAPSDEALLRDIKISKALGFNGARLHQKIFEPRFLYHCDREGYLVWGEHGNWGLNLSNPESFLNFMPEWLEAVERDFNHPSIIGWCPFNETWDYNGQRQNDRILQNIYKMTKALDSTRPCIDTSGNFHVITDIYDLHNYRQNVKEFSDCYSGFAKDGKFHEEHPSRQQYKEGQPLFISEYGGIKWNVDDSQKDAWGYGDEPKTKEEFIERYEGLTSVLLDNPKIMGFCYTQLYDIEQETNGLYDYDRKPKFDAEIFYKINSRKAAIELINGNIEGEN